MRERACERVRDTSGRAVLEVVFNELGHDHGGRRHEIVHVHAITVSNRLCGGSSYRSALVHAASASHALLAEEGWVGSLHTLTTGSHLGDAGLPGGLQADDDGHVFVLHGVEGHLRELRHLGGQEHLPEEVLVRAPELRLPRGQTTHTSASGLLRGRERRQLAHCSQRLVPCG